MTRIYALGDVHGHLAHLEEALERIEADGGPDAAVVFLGDYIDRGPDSKGVLETLINGLAAGRNWTILKGNHDAYLQEFIETGRAQSKIRPDLNWFDTPLGGAATMLSYGLDVTGCTPKDVIEEARRLVPAAHVDFIAQRPLMHVTDAFVFVHAGVRPGIALEDQVESDLIWIRHEFLDDPRDFGRLVVHGHTAVPRPEHRGNRVNLDGGTGFGRPLYPAVFEGRKVWLLTEDGRQILEPMA